LDIVGLKKREKDKVKNYSGGMKRRLNMAAGLLHRPKILYLDEPTVGVDPQSRNHIFESVKKIAKEYKMTIIYTSHYMEEVQALCDRVAIMDLGKIIAYDRVRNLVQTVEGNITIGISKEHKKVQKKIEILPGVEEIRKMDDKINIVAKDQSRVLPKILNIIDHLDTEITSLEILEPNLESVFLRLTGKRLRD
jgi:ABC-2 type transport system ATP-binding protein